MKTHDFGHLFSHASASSLVKQGRLYQKNMMVKVTDTMHHKKEQLSSAFDIASASIGIFDGEFEEPKKSKMAVFKTTYHHFFH